MTTDKMTEDQRAETSRARRSVPFMMADDAYVPAARYFDEEFFRLERDELWPRTWQPACRIEEVPVPGDFSEYRIAGRSVLVVRQGDGEIRAFENACPHRGTALGTGCGSFHGGQIVCPFHGWRFGLDGECSFVYAQRGFRPDTIRPDAIDLVDVAVALRWGFVWICLDPSGPTFEEHLGNEVVDVLDSIGLDRARVNWWRGVRIGANWKIALEAFLEAYHILQTHPELAPDAIGDEYDADAYAFALDRARGHGWIVDTETNPMASMSAAATMVLNNRVLFDGVDGWISSAQLEIMERLWAQVPAQLSERGFLERFFTEVYADAARRGAELPPRPMLGLAFVFPNLALINFLGNSLLYRFRPDDRDPEACLWEIWSVSVAPATAQVARPTFQQLGSQAELPPVYRQDASNMELQQRGLRSPHFEHSICSPRYENMIPNMHRRLDQLLAG